MSTLGLLDVGPMEMLVLGVAAIMLFGGDLPDIARRAGQMIGRIRAAANELTKQIDPPADLFHLPDPDLEARRALQTPPLAATPQPQAPASPSSFAVPSLAPPPTTAHDSLPEDAPPPPT